MTPSEMRAESARLVGQRLGLHFSGNRGADLARALEGLAAGYGQTVPEFLRRLEAAPEDGREWIELVHALTVRETYFFRDPDFFRALETVVLPSLIAARRAAGQRQLRLWSAGCATGEEAYSLAIVLDRVLPDLADWHVTILATDVDRRALAAARRAVYRPWALRATSAEILAQYFRPMGDSTMALIEPVRSRVRFVPLNLIANLAPVDEASFDIVCCRNVLMYLTQVGQQAVVARLTRALAPEGWLAVSAVETGDLLASLQAVSLDGAILYRRAAAGAPDGLRPRPPELGASAPVESGPRATTPRRVSSAPASPSIVPARPTREQQMADVRALADRGRLDEAARRCDELRTRDGADAELELLSASIALERDDLPAALTALRRLMYQQPDFVAAHFLLALVLRRQGKARGARRAMETAQRLLRSLPTDAPLPGGEGLTAGALGRRVRLYLRSTS